MDKPALVPKEDISAETKRVMKIFSDKYASKFKSKGESFYSIAADCGMDTSNVQEIIEEPANREIQSLIQLLMPYGKTLELKIVDFKQNTNGEH